MHSIFSRHHTGGNCCESDCVYSVPIHYSPRSSTSSLQAPGPNFYFDDVMWPMGLQCPQGLLVSIPKSSRHMFVMGPAYPLWLAMLLLLHLQTEKGTAITSHCCGRSVKHDKLSVNIAVNLLSLPPLWQELQTRYSDQTHQNNWTSIEWKPTEWHKAGPDICILMT